MLIKRCDICRITGCTDYECEEHSLTIRYYRNILKWLCTNCKEITKPSHDVGRMVD